MQQVVDTLEPGAYITSTDLQSALLQQAEKSLQRSAEAVAGREEEVEQRLGSLDTDMSNLMEQIEELKVTSECGRNMLVRDSIATVDNLFPLCLSLSLSLYRPPR